MRADLRGEKKSSGDRTLRRNDVPITFPPSFPPSRSVGSFLNETAKLFHGKTLYGNLRHLGKRFCFLDQKDMSDFTPRSVS